MKKSTLLYAVALGLLAVLLKVLEFRFLVLDHALEIYAGILALVFTALGIWMGLKLLKPKEVLVVEQIIKTVPSEGPFILDELELKRLGISKREYEVLELMASGMSNQEIADKLFVSLNTIKTHSSRIFEKLEVNRRTQAIQKAKELGLIP